MAPDSRPVPPEAEPKFSGRLLDTDALHAAISSVAMHRGISLRRVAEESSVSPSTLTRISHGQKPDADGLMSLLTWLGYSPPFTRRTDG